MGLTIKPARLPHQLLDEVELLEIPVNNGLGIQAHPVFQQGGVDAPKVVVEVQVSLQQLVRRQGRVLPVQASLDFRSIYSTLLENWMGLDAQPIVNGSFEKFDFV